MADCAAVAIRLQRADHWLAQLEGQRGVLRGGLCAELSVSHSIN
jgi:hypothetical protein